jgi:S1-C subfamily serine protease
MKIVGTLIVVILSCCSLGFGDSEAIVSPSANLNRYSYIAMPPLTDFQETGGATRADTMAFKEYLSELFQKEGLTVLQDYGSIDSLSSEKRLQVLRLNFGFNSDGRHISAWLALYDVMGKTFSSIGKKGGRGHTLRTGVLSALKSAFAEFKKYYSGFDPNLASAYAAELKEKFKNWETVDINEVTLQDYLDKNIGALDPIEGIWMLNRAGWTHRKTGILRNTNLPGRDFVEVSLEPSGSNFKVGSVLVGFQKTASGQGYIATFYNLDGSKQSLNSIVDANGTLMIYSTNIDTGKTDSMNFIKIYPQNVIIPSEQKNTPPQVASQGTGFAISSEGHIVTAYHVIKGAQTIKVYLSKESFVVAQTLHSDPMNDLAILKIEKPTSSFLKVAPMRSVKTGDRVFTIGFPMSSLLGEEAKYTEGVVSSLSGLKGASSFLQITVPVQPGNSGGALVNERGEVVGIITATAAILPFIEESGTLPQNINWAVKADYLRPLIELPEAEQKELNREQLIDRVKKATFFIEAQ